MRFIMLTIGLCCAQCLYAQQPSYSLYPIHSLLYNPAFTGHHGRSEVSFNHKQQWLGIAEAPTISTFQLHTAVEPQIAFGLQARSFGRGVVRTNTAHALFSYKFMHSRQTGLSLGLASGISHSGLRSEANYNPLDPAVASLAESQITADLKLGINYHYAGFNLGFTLTEIIPQKAYYNPLDVPPQNPFYHNYAVNIDYKFRLPTAQWAVHPFLQYQHFGTSDPFLEGGMLIHYKDLLQLGGLYRHHYGTSVLAGLQWKDFGFHYAYEMASSLVNDLGQGSHEIQLSFRFGKEVSAKAPEKQKQENKQLSIVAKDTVQTVPTEQKAVEARTDTTQADTKPAPENTEELVQHAVYYFSEAQPNELPVGYYVVAGTFKNTENAERLAKSLSQNGFFAASGYNTENQYYLVYVYRSGSIEKTREARDQFRKSKLLKDAWLLEVKRR